MRNLYNSHTVTGMKVYELWQCEPCCAFATYNGRGRRIANPLNLPEIVAPSSERSTTP
jgi:hypothetical protein